MDSASAYDVDGTMSGRRRGRRTRRQSVGVKSHGKFTYQSIFHICRSVKEGRRWKSEVGQALRGRTDCAAGITGAIRPAIAVNHFLSSASMAETIFASSGFTFEGKRATTSPWR